jgi:hypothetical protein
MYKRFLTSRGLSRLQCLPRKVPAWGPESACGDAVLLPAGHRLSGGEVSG